CTKSIRNNRPRPALAGGLLEKSRMMPEEEKDATREIEKGSNGDAAAAPSADLQKDLEAAKAQSAEYLEGWQRARAEFANYKRRVEKEQSEANQNATSRVIG